MPGNQLLRPSQLARDLGVSADWIRQEVAAGRLPHVEAGDVVLLDREAVEQRLLERARQCGEGVARDE